MTFCFGWTPSILFGPLVEAGNADEAMAILELRPDIHVVFTDVQIPGS